MVNTASECGFTPQYAKLEALWKEYRPSGLMVIGMPCNDFGAQEPGEDQHPLVVGGAGQARLALDIDDARRTHAQAGGDPGRAAECVLSHGQHGQAVDHPVPHHPTAGGVIKNPLPGLHIRMQHQLFQVLQQSPAG